MCSVKRCSSCAERCQPHWRQCVQRHVSLFWLGGDAESIHIVRQRAQTKATFHTMSSANNRPAAADIKRPDTMSRTQKFISWLQFVLFVKITAELLELDVHTRCSIVDPAPFFLVSEWRRSLEGLNNPGQRSAWLAVQGFADRKLAVLLEMFRVLGWEPRWLS